MFRAGQKVELLDNDIWGFNYEYYSQFGRITGVIMSHDRDDSMRIKLTAPEMLIETWTTQYASEEDLIPLKNSLYNCRDYS